MSPQNRFQIEQFLLHPRQFVLLSLILHVVFVVVFASNSQEKIETLPVLRASVFFEEPSPPPKNPVQSSSKKISVKKVEKKIPPASLKKEASPKMVPSKKSTPKIKPSKPIVESTLPVEYEVIPNADAEPIFYVDKKNQPSQDQPIFTEKPELPKVQPPDEASSFLTKPEIGVQPNLVKKEKTPNVQNFLPSSTKLEFSKKPPAQKKKPGFLRKNDLMKKKTKIPELKTENVPLPSIEKSDQLKIIPQNPEILSTNLEIEKEKIALPKKTLTNSALPIVSIEPVASLKPRFPRNPEITRKILDSGKLREEKIQPKKKFNKEKNLFKKKIEARPLESTIEPIGPTSITPNPIRKPIKPKRVGDITSNKESLKPTSSSKSALAKIWNKKNDQVGYRQALAKLVTSNWSIPHTSVKDFEILMSVRISLKGRIQEVELLKSSGVSALDAAAEKTIYLSVPFPDVPKALLNGQNSLKVVFRFGPGNVKL